MNTNTFNSKYEILASYTAPNPATVNYWADLSADGKGGILKYNNGEKWEHINEAHLNARLSDLHGEIDNTIDELRQIVENNTEKIQTIVNTNIPAINESLDTLNSSVDTINESISSINSNIDELQDEVNNLTPIKFTVNAATGTVLGKSVSELQRDITIDANCNIQGSVNNVTGFTEFSSIPEEQSGYYLALQFTPEEADTILINLVGGSRKGFVALDSDNILVIRLNSATHLIVVASKNGKTTTKVYNLENIAFGG